MVPFLGTLDIGRRIIRGIQKEDHNFDNHPCGDYIGIMDRKMETTL